MPRASRNWANRVAPPSASRRIKNVHRSPSTVRLRAMEQAGSDSIRPFYPWVAFSYRDARLGKPTQEDVMQIEGSTALVTGANRGLGRHLAQELLARGARVYGAARNPASVDLPGVTPIALDVTDPASVAAAADATGDVTLLVNNAGSSTGASLLDGPMADIELEMNTHFFGTLAVIRAFAPQLAAAGGGAVLNVLSALSWVSFPGSGAYCAAKSAEWSLTNALRQQLAGQGTQVAAL